MIINFKPEKCSVKELKLVQAEIRELREKNPKEPITVNISSGNYCFDETLVFSPEDSGTEHAPVTWKGDSDNPPVFSAGIEIPDWQGLESPINGLEDISGNIKVADLSDILPDDFKLLTVFDQNGVLPRSAIPFKTVDDEEITTDTRFGFDPEDFKYVDDFADAELHITPSHCFADNFLPIDRIDMAKGIAETSCDGTYKLTSKVDWWGVVDGHCLMENIKQGLGIPGTWYYSSKTKKLYVHFKDDIEKIIIPRLTEMIRFEGDFSSRNWARHIRFENIKFCHSNRQGWEIDREAVQHDWEIYDSPSAMVRLRNTENISIANCVFENAGSTALRADLHSVNNEFSDNIVRNIGCVGIALIGCGPGMKNEHHHNLVTGNHIHTCGVVKKDGIGILLCQSGDNKIANNLVHDLPYIGICLISGREGALSGRTARSEGKKGKDGNGLIDYQELNQIPSDWFHRINTLTCRYNKIEYNEVHDVMKELADGNGIYVSGTGVGNVVRRNYIHDISGIGCQAAMRLDDHQWYTRFIENVIVNVSGAGITIKDINDVENNIIIGWKRWGAILVRRSSTYGTNVRHNIMICTEETLGKDGAVPPFYDGGGFGGKLEEPTIDYNIYFAPNAPEKAEICLKQMREMNKDLHSVIADPGFKNWQKLDFSMPDPDCPALKIGFLPFEKWGNS